MDLNHSEHAQGELVDAWDEEDGGKVAATLARHGFLPELTPVFPGVTAPLPQDPLGNEGGPAPPPPWITRLRNCNVRADFQTFLNALYQFHQGFRKPKYASTFSVMRYPMHSFLQSILSPKPPQDVLVATFSGSMQAQIQLLILKKSGKAKTAQFYRHVNAVCISLTTFVNTCQAGIRQWRELEEKGITHFAPDAVAAAASPTRQSLVHMEPMSELIRKIDALDSPGESALSWTQVMKSSFHYYQRAMITSTILIGFAVGAGLQSILLAHAEWEKFQQSTGLDVRLLLPLVMAAIAIIIAMIVMIKRVRWLKLDYSTRKQQEAETSRRERMANKRIITKQERSRRLISSASDESDHHPIDLDKETRAVVAKQHQRQQQRHADYGSSTRSPRAANAGTSEVPSSSSSSSSIATGGYQSGDVSSVMTRAHAATIVIDSVPDQLTRAPVITATAQQQSNPFLEQNERERAATVVMDNNTDTAINSNGTSDDIESNPFMLPPYDASLMSASPPIFSAPPPLPGDSDDSKRTSKKKKTKKSAQSTTPAFPTFD